MMKLFCSLLWPTGSFTGGIRYSLAGFRLHVWKLFGKTVSPMVRSRTSWRLRYEGRLPRSKTFSLYHPGHAQLLRRKLNLSVEYFSLDDNSVWFPWKVLNEAAHLKDKYGFSCTLFFHSCCFFSLSLRILDWRDTLVHITESLVCFSFLIAQSSKWQKFKLLQRLSGKCLIQMDFQQLP